MLLSWLKSHNVSKNKFCRMIGCAPRMVDWWCSGRSVPGLIYAFIIEKATEGGVSVEMWLGTEIGKQLWREQLSKGELSP